MASQEAIETVAEVVDVVEETLDTLERIPQVNLNGTTKAQQYLILSVTAGVSAVASGLIVYHFTKKKMRLHYEELASQEIAEARQRYSLLSKDAPELADPVAALEHYVGAVEENEYGSAAPEQSDEERLAVRESMAVPNDTKDLPEPEVGVKPMKVAYDKMRSSEDRIAEADEIIENDPEAQAQVVINNVWVQAGEEANNGWDYDREKKLRDTEKPYVISHDEFFQNDPDYEQVSISYFGFDSVLVDARDEVINETETTVGDDNLTRFGHGSNDKNIVYIRNEKLGLDFEVTLSEGSYTKEVLGLDPENQHSGPRGLARRTRAGDDG